jgi:hypothetical protein
VGYKVQRTWGGVVGGGGSKEVGTPPSSAHRSSAEHGVGCVGVGYKGQRTRSCGAGAAGLVVFVMGYLVSACLLFVGVLYWQLAAGRPAAGDSRPSPKTKKKRGRRSAVCSPQRQNARRQDPGRRQQEARSARATGSRRSPPERGFPTTQHRTHTHLLNRGREENESEMLSFLEFLPGNIDVVSVVTMVLGEQRSFTLNA